MHFSTSPCLLFLLLAFSLADRTNDKRNSEEGAVVRGRRHDTNDRSHSGRRWTTSRDSPYQKIVSSYEQEVPELQGGGDSEVEDQAKAKSHKRKWRTSAPAHDQIASETSSTGEIGNSEDRGSDLKVEEHQEGQRTPRRRSTTSQPLETSSESSSTTTSPKKRRRPATTTTTTTTLPPQTMSDSLYQYFRPLEQDVPQDDIVPFLDFGRKLSPIVPTPSGANSIENRSAITKLKPRGHHDEKESNSSDEELLQEDMDVTVVKKAIERNSVPRGKLRVQSSGISDYYRKRVPVQIRTTENLISTSDSSTASSVSGTKNSVMRKFTRHQVHHSDRSRDDGKMSVKHIPELDSGNVPKDVEIIPEKRKQLLMRPLQRLAALKQDTHSSPLTAESSLVKTVIKEVPEDVSSESEYKNSTNVPNIMTSTVSPLVKDQNTSSKTEDKESVPLINSTQIQENPSEKVLSTAVVTSVSIQESLKNVQEANYTNTSVSNVNQYGNNTRNYKTLHSFSGENKTTPYLDTQVQNLESKTSSNSSSQNNEKHDVTPEHKNTTIRNISLPTISREIYRRKNPPPIQLPRQLLNINTTQPAPPAGLLTPTNATLTKIPTKFKSALAHPQVNISSQASSSVISVTSMPTSTSTTTTTQKITTVSQETEEPNIPSIPTKPTSKEPQYIGSIKVSENGSTQFNETNPVISSTEGQLLPGKDPETTSSGQTFFIGGESPKIIPLQPNVLENESTVTNGDRSEAESVPPLDIYQETPKIISYIPAQLPEVVSYIPTQEVYNEDLFPTFTTTLVPVVDTRPDTEPALVQEQKNSSTPRPPQDWTKVGEVNKEVEVVYSQTFGLGTYLLVALGIIPVLLGALIGTRFVMAHNRKKQVLDESEYSSEYNRSPLGTSTSSPLPTKLPRIPTHVTWPDREPEKVPPPAVPTVSPSSRWEFPREKLRLQTLLGQGNFGQVWKAEADDIAGHEGLTRLVAVKTVKESANAREREDLLRELGIMQELGSHPNVVTLLGCCTEKEPIYLVMEYVMYGKLLSFLRDHRTRAHYYNFSDATDALTSRDLTVFGYCVARGMDYLANKSIIHRDLAARNVLVDHNKLCKIADFGMSRNVRDTGQIYEQRQSKGALPIRWMAPESLHFSLFTHKTDVWSFGILMWEIVTLGSTPYATMGAREVMRRVRDGYRLERPSHCRPELFRVISRCWHSEPSKRPTFAELKAELATLLSDTEMHGSYVDLDSFADEMRRDTLHRHH